MYFDRTYFLAPSSAEAAAAALRAAAERDEGDGHGRDRPHGLRGNENFCLIRPKGDALVLETLFLAEDVKSQAEIDEAVEETKVKEPELDLARQLIDEPRRRVRPDRVP